MSSIRPVDGLWNGSIQLILEDSIGYLWMTCNRGFFWVARADLIAFTKYRLDKVRSTAFGRGHSLRSTLLTE